ncbi:RNA polymerase sigma-70 factor [Flavobacteriaceae bacterium F08102]|nr:RNA polymerase sigma-70 factor [Flavobacteriaceae bacterium F08102]
MKKKEIHITPENIISRLRNGEVVAYETLFRLYYSKLLHLAKNYLVYKEDAEHIVQNIFLKLWEQKEKFEHVTNVNNYLYSMCKNACLDQLKHEKIKAKYAEQISNKTAINRAFILDEAASLLLENELESQIYKSIELLPSKCKKVFMKSRIEGLNHKEIADELGISKKTVENHITKALGHMRLQLKEFLTLFL